jgi:hypothetical protein
VIAPITALIALVAAAPTQAVKTTWLSPEQYAERMKDPANLVHKRLKGLKIEVGKNGRIPRWSGQFNSVFRAVSTGGTRYALRVMHTLPGDKRPARDPVEMAERYRIVREYMVDLRAHGERPPEIGRVQYLEDAFNDGTRNVSVIQTRWLDSKPLDEYVGE